MCLRPASCLSFADTFTDGTASVQRTTPIHATKDDGSVDQLVTLFAVGIVAVSSIIAVVGVIAFIAIKCGTAKKTKQVAPLSQADARLPRKISNEAAREHIVQEIHKQGLSLKKSFEAADIILGNTQTDECVTPARINREIAIVAQATRKMVSWAWASTGGN